MNGPHKPTTSDDGFEPLVPDLEWFGKEFAKLPKAVQEHVQREGPQFAGLWDEIAPRGRRNQARRHDIQHHPGLAHEHKMLWDKDEEIDECKRTASGIPLENRTMSDVKLQGEEERRLQKERAVLGAVLGKSAEALGLDLPDDWGAGGDAHPAAENVAEKSMADTEKGKTSKGGAPERVETKRPTIPAGKLRGVWPAYLKRHPDPNKRPSVTMQQADMAAEFPDHAPPSPRAMQGLRANPPTPVEWRNAGRRKGIKTENQTGKSK
jgi:hypothetical protein